MDIKEDKRNYRVHSKKNKQAIKRSLIDCGAGRSIVIDSDGEIIAGNGVYEQARAIGMPVRVVETDGSELVVVQRTDLQTSDERRKLLAMADNATSDMSVFDFDLLAADFDRDLLSNFGVDVATFEEKMQRCEEMDETDEYNEFVDKFKPKKTTDDCYTPPAVYDAVADWVANEYGVERRAFVRPFYPGGDYQAEKYPEGCVVVDNPPFSILAEIRKYYNEHGVRYFLFAPHLTLLSSSSASSCDTALVERLAITYENGAVVSTSFVTNMEPHDVALRTSPTLYAAVAAAVDGLKNKNEMAKYSKDVHIVQSTTCERFAQFGINFIVPRYEAVLVSKMDNGVQLYGGGLLVSDRIAQAQAQAQAQRVGLSEREQQIVEQLNRNANGEKVQQ